MSMAMVGTGLADAQIDGGSLRGRAETRVALGEGLPRACASSWTHVEPIGDFAVLQVTSEVDADAAPKLREQMRELATKGAVHLIADLGQVGFLDSTGLGALVGGLKRLGEAGGSLPLVMGPIKTAALAPEPCHLHGRGFADRSDVTIANRSPHQVINADQSFRLIGDELDETEVAQVSDAPARHRRYGRAEHRIIRVIADPDQRLDQDVERLSRQALHLAQGAIFQPRPPAHEAGRYTRRASSSGMPPLTGPRAASSASR